MTDIESQIAANWDLEDDRDSAAEPRLYPIAVLYVLREVVLAMRRARDEAQAQWDKAHEAMMLTLADLQGQLSVCKADCETAETALRDATCLYYLDHDEKHPIPGVGIREVTRLVYEEERARAWAIEHHHPELLRLHAPSFEKTARALGLPFVVTDKIIRATIATDLAAAIAAAKALETEEQLP